MSKIYEDLRYTPGRLFLPPVMIGKSSSIVAYILTTLLISTCCTCLADTQNVIPVLPLQEGDFVLEPAFDQTRFLYDFNHEFSPEAVLGKLENFTAMKTRYIQFDTGSAASPTIWLHFRVRNDTSTDQLWVVDIHRSTLASVQVYRAQIDTRAADLILDCTGNQCSKGSRLGSFINTLLDLDAGESADILVAFINPASEILPIAFASPSRFQSMIQRYALFIWTANGAWIALLVVAILIGRSVGWALMLSFVVYAAIGFILLLNNEGFLSGVASHNTMIGISQVSYHLLFLALLIFSRYFFRTKSEFPATDVISTIFITVSLTALVLQTSGVASESTELFSKLINPVVAVSIHIVTAIRAWNRRIVGSAVVLAGAALMLVAIASNIVNEYFPGLIHRDSVNAITHTAFLLEAVLFAAAIGLRQLVIRRERDRALEAELISTRERLRLSEELQHSMRRFDQAKKQAEERQLKLATLSHDLKQPLLSLKRSLSDMNMDSESSHRMQAAFSYLEELAQRQLDERSDSVPLTVSVQKEIQDDAQSSQRNKEDFPIYAVLDNVISMFNAEASAKGLDLRYRRSTAMVRADPIVVMRIASNLVSNAINHVDSGSILVGCRRSRKMVRLQVLDTGKGMTQSELKKSLNAFEKGKSSEGSGLGLHLVTTLSTEEGLTFCADSIDGRGSCFTVSIPKAGVLSQKLSSIEGNTQGRRGH